MDTSPIVLVVLRSFKEKARGILSPCSGLYALEAMNGFIIVLKARELPELGSTSRWEFETYHPFLFASGFRKFLVGEALEESFVNV